MLRHTFCHLPNIGPKKESALWQAGVRAWSDFDINRVAVSRRDEMLRQLEASEAALAAGDTAFFAGCLPSHQQWRLFGEFARRVGEGSGAFRRDGNSARDLDGAAPRVAYLDIETTGMMGHPGDHITTVALYDGHTVRTYVHGRNLDDFPADVAQYTLLVTYNGKCFDLPYLRSYFGISLAQGHIDLRYVLHRLGYRGGLKGCEKQFGLSRDGTEGIDGYFAVLLWREFQRRGDERVLDTLLAYNVDDVLSLECLMVIAWNRCLRETPFGDALTMYEGPVRENPFVADRDVVERVKSAYLSPAWG